MAGWFGIDRSNHNFDERKSWGKNTFTNAAPISIAQFLSISLGERPVQIEAHVTSEGLLTRQTLRDWSEIIGADPTDCRFDFESPFAPYGKFTPNHVAPDKSDVVVSDGSGPTRAFEIKLTAVPDSTTVRSPHDSQSSEIVARQPTIEQLAFSICESYEGNGGRHALNDLVVEHIPNPVAFPWSDSDAVRSKMNEVIALLRSVATRGIENQIPAVLNVIWRTQGARPILEESAFDVFVWTNFAFMNMFIESAANSSSRAITRPQRSLVWLAKMLYDYSAQGYFNRTETTKSITYGTQTDKAGAFAGGVTLPYLRGPQLIKPRVSIDQFNTLMQGDSLQFLAPERRLDAVLYMDHLIRTGDIPEMTDLISDADELRAADE